MTNSDRIELIPQMVLVDTTVWIDLLQGREKLESGALETILSSELDVFITGIKNRRDRVKVKTELDHFILIHPTLETHIQAAEIFDACRKKGFTIRSGIDCLIAALAIEYDLKLLEKDRDYRSMARVIPLKIVEII